MDAKLMEILKSLKAARDEELADMEKYQKLSCEAEKLECYTVSEVLMDIAHEEKTHYKMISYLIGEIETE